jgi:Flp pilus assembly pilin Flp
MFGLFVQLLKNRDGFTAIEYGLVAALILIVVGQLVANKL